jgi:hypothetical protein
MWRMPLMNNEPIIGADCAVVVIDRPVVNIDDIFELDLADWMLAREAAEARADTRNSKETMP